MVTRSYEVLLIDDNEDDYEEIRRELYFDSSNQVIDFKITWRKTLLDGAQTLRERSFDLILLDLNLPDAREAQGLLHLRSISEDIPIVILSGIYDETLAMRLVGSGAQDYLNKAHLHGLLRRALMYAVQRQEIVRSLQETERSARGAAQAKSAFLANMSHEIRTPLTAVIGYSEALLSSTLQSDERSRALQSIFSNGSHLLQVINDILDLSKIEAGELQISTSKEDLRVVLRDISLTFSGVATSKGLQFNIELLPPIPQYLDTDFFRLKQILFNLVGNAVKFTSEGFVKVLVRCDDPQSNVIFEVKDSGIGIPDEAKEKLFHAFSQGDASRTREFGGTGLGLVISSQLARHLGGEIRFQSRHNVGSVFTVQLPLGETGRQSLQREIPPLEEPSQSHQANPSSAPLTGKVLVVDDVEDNRSLIHLLLRQVGLTVTLVEDGSSALAKVRSEQFDLVLLDMQLPDMDGRRVAQILRSEGYHLPIVAVTASVLDQSLRDCLQAGCDASLRKPFRREELLNCVRQFLGENGQLDESDAEEPRIKDDALAEVKKSFVRKLPNRLDEIESAFESQDLNRLKAEAHRLIASGLFGFQELSHLAGVLESLIIQEQTGGLGLVEALVKRIKNEVGKLAMQQRAEEHDDSNSEKRTSLPVIIVADDDEISLKVVCRILGVKGFLVAPARTMEEALAHSNDGPCALLVVGLEMNNASGSELVSRLRKKLNANLPVIATTSRSIAEARQALGELRVDRLLTKPLSRDRVFEALDAIISDTLHTAPERSTLTDSGDA